MPSKREQVIAQIRGLRAAHKQAFGATRRRKKIPAPVRPRAIALSYLQGIESLVLDPMHQAVQKHLYSLLSGMAEHAIHIRKDAASKKTFIETIADQFANEVTPAQIGRLAQRIGQRTSEFQADQLRRQIKTAVGVDPLMHEPRSIEVRVTSFTEQNVALIKSVPQRYFSGIEQDLITGVRAGHRAEEIQSDLEDRFSVAETDAARIANDQVGKFFGELTKVRQESLGIDQFTWRSVNDNRVRDEHDELDGEVFNWDDLPIVDGEEASPGSQINCRCYAEPFLDDILEGLDDEG